MTVSVASAKKQLIFYLGLKDFNWIYDLNVRQSYLLKK
jgi:hypothetical protein